MDQPERDAPYVEGQGKIEHADTAGLHLLLPALGAVLRAYHLVRIILFGISLVSPNVPRDPYRNLI